MRRDHLVRPAGVDNRGHGREHHRPPNLERGLQDAGGKTLLVIRDSRGRLDVQRREAQAESGADQQQRGQDHGGVGRSRADPQEQHVPGGQAGEAGRDHPGRAEPVEYRPDPWGCGGNQDPGRQEGQRGRQR